MSESLFFEPQVQFEKVAAEVTMPEDANQWPNELMQELFKQVPYIADFEPHVVMDRVDAERGFGFGHIEIQNKTEIQHGAPEDAMRAAGVKSARIPIVIKDRKLQPLDLLVTDDSHVLPLTEARLRQAVFRPQAFDITGRGPGDMSMIGQLYPPYRQNYGFGGGGATMNVGMGKQGSAILAYKAAEKKAFAPGKSPTPFGAMTDGDNYEANSRKNTLGGRGPSSGIGSKVKGLLDAASSMGKMSSFSKATKLSSVLSAILPTINESDYSAFFQKVASDLGLQAQYVVNGFATGDALKILSAYEPASPHKLASATLQNLKPTVAQLRKEASGYSLKTAAHNCWLPETKALDRGEALRLLGEKVVLAADLTGAATMTLGDGVVGHDGVPEAQSPEKDMPELISQFGLYKVKDDHGKQLVGYVFTNLIDVDGQALPMSLFTNGSQMAVQGDIVGVSVGDGAGLFESRPRGMGVFYHLLPNGRAEATIPMNIKATMASPEQGGVILHADTFDGREVQVIVQPNIQRILPSPEGDHMLIPDSFSWLPLGDAEPTSLVSDPGGFDKEAQAALSLATVQIRSGGVDSFSIDGFPVEKLASAEKHFLSLDDTMFMLGALGVDMGYAQQKLGHASAFSAPVLVRVGRHIKTASARLDEAKTAAAGVLRDMPLFKVDLVKEAAVIPDPMAVDTVLSLGFLNPENVGMFISYMPAIDEAQLKMCELLLAARLGLRDVPVSALEKAVRTTEDVLEGLKVLAFQKA
jgi:hypothetical protein